VSALPSQTPGILARYGLRRADADRAVWVIAPDGRRAAGAEAVNVALRACGGPLALLGRLGALGPLGWLEARVYAWVAAHRALLSRFYSTTPACEEPGASCDP